MPRFKMVNSKQVQLTAEEEKQCDQSEKTYLDEAPARAFERLRRQRDEKLREPDFYGLSDTTMSDEMALYRDQLRKLPNGLNDETVLNFTWPTKP